MLFECTNTILTKKLTCVLRNDIIIQKKNKCKRKVKAVPVFKNQPIRHV